MLNSLILFCSFKNQVQASFTASAFFCQTTFSQRANDFTEFKFSF